MKKIYAYITAGLVLFSMAENCSADFWHMFTNGNDIVDMASHEHWLWCATTGGVVRWDTRDMTYRKFITLDGLPTNGINCIDVGPNGTVWCGTDYGAVRYDGVKWETFTEDDGLFVNMVDSVVISPSGIVWFSDWSRGDGHFGLSRYDGVDWTTYKYPEDTPIYYVAEMCYGLDNVLYIAGSKGIYKFENEMFSLIDDQLGDYPIYSLDISPSGVMWYSYDNRIKRYDNKGFMTFIDVRAQAIAIDHNDIAWLGYSDTVLSHNGSFIEYELPGGGITAVEVMDDSTVCVGKSGGASGEQAGMILKFDNGSWLPFSTNDDLKGNALTWIAPTPHKKILIGAPDGIVWFDGFEFTDFNDLFDWKLRYTLSGAVDKRGAVWIGDGLALNCIDGEKWTTISHQDYLGGQNVQSIVFDQKDNIWVATVHTAMLPVGHGISHYDGVIWKKYTTENGLVANWIQTLIVAPDGNIWAGGKSRYEGGWEKKSLTSISDYQETTGGISRFDGSTWTSWTPDDGLVHYDVLSLAVEPDGDIWCGTSDGVSHFDGENFTNFTTADGLANDHVNSVAVDAEGFVWFGTNDGASVFDGVNWKTYTTADGLPDNVVNVIVIDHNDNVYFCTDHGFSVLERSPVHVDSHAIRPVDIRITGNTPNPFNPSTTIRFTLPGDQYVDLSVYNSVGQRIRTLASERIAAGEHSVAWDGRDESGRAVSSGIYIAGLQSDGRLATHRMTLVR